MKFLFSIILSLVLTTLSVAQNFQGIATYKTSTSLDLKMDSTQMNPDQQAMIMNMLRKQLQKEYELFFNKSESVYKEVDQLDQEAAFSGIMAMVTGADDINYKNVGTRANVRQTEFFGKRFLIKDTLELTEWKLGKESKQIGSYTCYKATAQRVVTNRTFSSEEDEEGNHSNEEQDTIELVAWYTPQIPISQGPDNFWGLPGLIMEVDNGQTVMLCSKVVLNPKNGVNIEEPKEGEEVSEQQFNDIRDQKLKEMQEMYGGNRSGRGGGGSMRIQISR